MAIDPDVVVEFDVVRAELDAVRARLTALERPDPVPDPVPDLSGGFADLVAENHTGAGFVVSPSARALFDPIMAAAGANRLADPTGDAIKLIADGRIYAGIEAVTDHPSPRVVVVDRCTIPRGPADVIKIEGDWTLSVSDFVAEGVTAMRNTGAHADTVQMRAGTAALSIEGAVLVNVSSDGIHGNGMQNTGAPGSVLDLTDVALIGGTDPLNCLGGTLNCRNVHIFMVHAERPWNRQVAPPLKRAPEVSTSTMIGVWENVNYVWPDGSVEPIPRP